MTEIEIRETLGIATCINNLWYFFILLLKLVQNNLIFLFFFSKNSCFFFLFSVCFVYNEFNEFWLRTYELKFFFYVFDFYAAWPSSQRMIARDCVSRKSITGGYWFMSVSHHVWYILFSTTIVLEENVFERKRKQHSLGKGACPEAHSVYMFQK